MSTRSLILTAVVTALCLGLWVDEAQAQSRSFNGEVLVVLAREGAGRIDPTLANVPALRRPPFNSFSSMEVLSRPRVQLRVERPVTVELPNGRRLQLVLQQVMPDGRFRVRVSINRPNQNDYLPLLHVVASPGDPFFVAGQSHAGGTLVIGVSIGDRPAGAAAATKARPAGASMRARPTMRAR